MRDANPERRAGVPMSGRCVYPLPARMGFACSFRLVRAWVARSATCCLCDTPMQGVAVLIIPRRHRRSRTSLRFEMSGAMLSFR